MKCKFCNKGRVARNEQGECYKCVADRNASGVKCSCGANMYDRESGLCKKCLTAKTRSGIVCKHCDKNRKIHAKGKCRACYERQLKIDNPEYHERSKAYQREKRKDPEAKKASRERHIERWGDPDYREKAAKKKWVNHLSKYNLTQETYDTLVSHGCCICKNKKAVKFHIDHCHKTGLFRGILCSKCNNGLGMLGDTAESLQNATNYLIHFEKELL